ncbi:MAG: biopolymer transporter ExbD [Proteobacteria bacterium]|uniref:Biopolymer transporter ExbD n=2 Tax=Lysobacteraceae TaxID=32033 RepID=A0ABS7TEX5_9GAMM|nr:biopolymer transporter ExbD [Thermomonas beijingensis]MBS0459781.1 biopolymer transporter ExbD [Pseudomonadota bacterium]MBZ4186301.1 biopolymer transporter ExbD [Thermomonas beijingensis]MDE2381518.1 biopolymer transporter ExbD [Xanthomonadaceae bacterium]
MAEINVTPLVDVMLVLLIIFMITTPLMNHKVKVALPEATLVKKEEKKQQIPPITISVTETGELFLNDEPTTKQAIESRLSVEAQKVPQPPLQIRGDKTTAYHLVSDVVKIAQAQGMAKVGFITTPPKKG